jgi:hypothetical protein
MVRHSRAFALALVIGVGLMSSALTQPARAATASVVEAPLAAQAAIRRALKLLPRRPVQVSVVGPERVGADSRERFARSEAFFSQGSPIVYVTSHSPVLQAAQQGSAVHVHVLAAIIWHEMAHIEGADEPAAQKQEETLWTRFIRDDRIERVDALRYLKAMSERHP